MAYIRPAYSEAVTYSAFRRLEFFEAFIVLTELGSCHELFVTALDMIDSKWADRIITHLSARYNDDALPWCAACCLSFGDKVVCKMKAIMFHLTVCIVLLTCGFDAQLDLFSVYR